MSLLIDSARRLRVLPSRRSRPPPYCQVCFAPYTQPRIVHDRRSKDTRAVWLCPRCGFVEIPDGGPASTAVRAPGPPEVAMARLAGALLSGPDRSVLLWRPGEAGTRRYDVVVAADVIGEFRDPHVHFAELFGRVAPGGLLICSIQIYDGGKLDRERYIFDPGHASYYSSESLRRIAAAHRMRVDIQIPTVQATKNHHRWRYVVFTRRRGSHREADRGSTNPNDPE